MPWSKKQKIADASLALLVVIIASIALVVTLLPSITPVEFSTVSKNSDLYDKPIFVKFNWKSDNQIIVGSPVSFSAELIGLPYSSSDEQLEPITLQFLERQMDYYGSEGETSEEEIDKRDRVKFHLDSEENIFRSNQIMVRFIAQEPIDVELCDENIQKCIIVKNNIVPAPRTMEIEIHQNRISTSIAYLAIIFSSVIVWGRLRPTK